MLYLEIGKSFRFKNPSYSFLGSRILVPSCLAFVLFVVLVLVPIMHVFRLGYVWIPESPPIWERAADSFYHLSHLFTCITL